MSPEEKAKELIEKFETVDDCDEHYSDRYSPCSHQAKQCALLAVEELISSTAPDCDRFEPYYKEILNENQTSAYWEEVKQHIQNL